MWTLWLLQILSLVCNSILGALPACLFQAAHKSYPLVMFQVSNAFCCSSVDTKKYLALLSFLKKCSHCFCSLWRIGNVWCLWQVLCDGIPRKCSPTQPQLHWCRQGCISSFFISQQSGHFFFYFSWLMSVHYLVRMLIFFGSWTLIIFWHFANSGVLSTVCD